MRKTKLEKGITLIALIITIVVLLILAVVSIGAIKNSKIISHSQNAADEYITAQEKEQIQLGLSEWQLQKNIPNNSESFKSVMDEALKKSNAIITGSNDGPLTVKFSKTDNKYKVTKDGEITKIANLDGTTLEKYIFGQELEGRTMTDILNMGGSIAFKDDEQTEEDETQTIGAEFLTTGQESKELGIIYFKVQDITYKFAADVSTYKTNAEYGIVKVYNPNEEGEDSKVGKTVEYDKKTWTIMYDDETNGLQMICNETYKYNNDNFYLGYNDSSITDWDSLNTDEDEEFRTEDLNKNGKLDTDLEKSMYSYNNAITTLNNACKSVVTANDNILDIRCVGSNPTNKKSENADFYTSENLAKWPEGNSTYSAGIGNGKGKSTDLNYVTDFDRIVGLGINKSDTYYWLASRFVGGNSSYVYFGMRYVYSDGYYNHDALWNVRDSDARGDNGDEALRPVVSLSSTVQLTPSESGGTTDYVLN